MTKNRFVVHVTLTELTPDLEVADVHKEEEVLGAKIEYPADEKAEAERAFKRIAFIKPIPEPMREMFGEVLDMMQRYYQDATNGENSDVYANTDLIDRKDDFVAYLVTSWGLEDSWVRCDSNESTYIISADSYMGSDSEMEQFQGTWRQLLEYVNGVTDENRDEEFQPGRTIKDLADNELVKLFNEANGDGQPYYMVWSVEQGKKVLG